MAGQVGFLFLGQPSINNASLYASIKCEKRLTMVLFIQWHDLYTNLTIASMLSMKHRDYIFFSDIQVVSQNNLDSIFYHCTDRDRKKCYPDDGILLVYRIYYNSGQI